MNPKSTDVFVYLKGLKDGMVRHVSLERLHSFNSVNPDVVNGVMVQSLQHRDKVLIYCILRKDIS